MENSDPGFLPVDSTSLQLFSSSSGGGHVTVVFCSSGPRNVVISVVPLHWQARVKIYIGNAHVCICDHCFSAATMITRSAANVSNFPASL